MEKEPGLDFIRSKVAADTESGRFGRSIRTRFPPEPNGFLHIGHAKPICLNFGIAEEFAGANCNLRLDDTNPEKEDTRFVEGIKEDIKWLGFDWGEKVYHASDHFEQLYELALKLVEKGKAYVCSLSPEELRKSRGTLTEPGTNSPYRERSIEENIELFKQMRAGAFEDGQHVLRAKIDMSSPNINMRDPSLYRIRRKEHYRRGNEWPIYPMYDYAHCVSDALEGITHSLCSIEFEDHRPLYDWILRELGFSQPPEQTEFARLNVNYTVLSKRKLRQLVDEGHVEGWDDPRMPTLSGLRRRGVTPEAIREFCSRIGVSKAENLVDVSLLNFCLREHLNKNAKRVMAVLDPLKLIIENYPEDKAEELEAENNPEDESAGKRLIPFCRELYVEREDFIEEPPKKWFRLAPGKEVRLKHAYYVTCKEVIKDESGKVIELHCSYDPETKGGWSDDGRKVRGTLHWVSARHAIPAEIRLFEHLFTEESPDKDDFLASLNPDSLQILSHCLLEPGLKEAQAGEFYQFIRQGYFTPDSKLSRDGAPVFNRATPLKDGWARIERNR